MLWGEFWLADLTGGVGSEQGGYRPVIIVSNNIGNKHASTVIVCPVTSTVRNYNATHIRVSCLAKDSYIMCEQVRVIDKTRLKKYICSVSEADYHDLKDKLRLTLSL